MQKKGSFLMAFMLVVMCISWGCGKAKTESGMEVDNTQKQNVTADRNTNSTDTEKPDLTKTYVQPEMKGEITVSAFYEQEFLTVAAKQFMKKYPDVTVTINLYGGSGENAVSDFQTYLNTKIMSGKAEDIFFNSFLPVAKYSEMGVFADLSEYIALTPEFTDENYFLNALKAAKQKDGSIFLIPYMARFDCITYSAKLLDAKPEIKPKISGQEAARFTDSMDIAEKLRAGADHAYLIHLGEISYMDYLIKDQFSSFIDMENGRVQIGDSYVSLLEKVKGLESDGSFGSNISNFYNTDYEFAAGLDYDVQAAFYELDAGAGIAHTFPLANEDGKVTINANGCLALNSTSDHKDLAWEFIRYVLSDEVQSLPSIHGLTVNKAGFEQAVIRYYDFYAGGRNTTVDRERYRELLYGWMETIEACDTVDSALWTLIDEENEKFFSGKQTAGETAKNLQKKLTQYFNE